MPPPSRGWPPDVKNCVIAGVVVGNVAASESVEITNEGRMVGDINAPRVIIVEGASFRGRIDMGEVELEHPALGPEATGTTLGAPTFGAAAESGREAGRSRSQR